MAPTHSGVCFRNDLVVKTINRPARREEGEYREYLTDEQHSRPGWIGSRMPSYLWSWPLGLRTPTTGRKS